MAYESTVRDVPKLPLVTEKNYNLSRELMGINFRFYDLSFVTAVAYFRNSNSLRKSLGSYIVIHVCSNDRLSVKMCMDFIPLKRS